MTTAMATVTSKGQITIPKAIRDALGIGERSRLVFVIEGNSARLVPIGGRSLTELAGALASERSWPGMDAARQAYRERLAEQLAPDGQ